jgi:hypothetical protein
MSNRNDCVGDGAALVVASSCRAVPPAIAASPAASHNAGPNNPLRRVNRLIVA